jgi:hypothetical protein
MLGLLPVIAPTAGGLFLADVAFAKKKTVEGIVLEKIYQLGVRIFTKDVSMREALDFYTVILLIDGKERRVVCDKIMWLDLAAGQAVNVSTTVGFFTKIVYDYEIIK